MLLLILAGAAFAWVEPRYLSYNSIATILRHMAANGLAALGLTFVVVVRKFDISFAGIASFAGMTIGFAIASGAGLAASIAVGLVVGSLIGLINGVLISYFRFPDIVTTIASGSIASGMAFFYSGGQSIMQNFFTSGIIDINDQRYFGIGISLYFLLAVYLAAWVLMHLTRYGACFYATGENPVSARFSGVNTKGYVASSFVICGLTSVLAVVLILAESGSADTMKGANLLMPAYASVFLGAAIFGRASVFATLAGTLLITMLLDGFSIVGVPYYYSDGVISAILLGGVLLFDERARLQFQKLSLFRFNRTKTGGRAIE